MYEYIVYIACESVLVIFAWNNKLSFSNQENRNSEHYLSSLVKSCPRNVLDKVFYIFSTDSLIIKFVPNGISDVPNRLSCQLIKLNSFISSQETPFEESRKRGNKLKIARKESGQWN